MTLFSLSLTLLDIINPALNPVTSILSQHVLHNPYHTGNNQEENEAPAEEERVQPVGVTVIVGGIRGRGRREGLG